jgi:glycosyltransferase involved in cell wall biosynthesis
MDEIGKMKITATVITYNEAQNIRRCLESLHDLVDEIIVVDSHSEDETRKICEEYGAKVTSRDFPGHIEQKNHAISLASYPYILSLDADEALSRNLRKSIKQLKENEDSTWADGYTMKRKNYFMGKWIHYGIWLREYKIRLFNKHAATWGGVNPHDYIVMKPGKVRKHLKGNLLHYPYGSIGEFVDQMNRFSDIAAAAYHSQNQRATVFKIVVNPLWRFLRSYIFSLGFLDGLRGLFLSIMMSFYAFMKYLKLWYFNKGIKHQHGN